jgi:alpha-N-arabinofuranosidase
VKLVNYSTTPRAVKVNLAGAKKMGSSGKAFVMASDDLNTMNTIQEPKKLTPKEEAFSVSGSNVSYTLAPNSFTVLRIPARK